MKIHEIEQYTSLDRATIRFYEKEGFITPTRLSNGYRDYSQDDIDLLLKIKLLRQLGFSLEQILSLEDGSIAFEDALARQIVKLSENIQFQNASVLVCSEMSKDAVQFRSLDSKYYLQRHKQLLEEQGRREDSIFSESMPKEEPHPWLRFFARMLDYTILNAVIKFQLIVVFRVRPVPSNFMNILLGVAVGFLMIPFEALLLSKLGTTPGKFVFGIRLEDKREGGFLPYRDALSRAASVFLKGNGMYLPIIETITMAVRYCALTGRSIKRFARYDEVSMPESMEWDYNVETSYHPWSWKRGAALVSVLSILISLTVATAQDSIKPKYRGDALTIAQYADNYNTYLAYLKDSSIYKLNEDGVKEVPPKDPYVFVVSFNGEESNENGEYTYETNGDSLCAVIYENSWSEAGLLSPLTDDTVVAASVLLLSQKGCGIDELKEFSELWNSNLCETDVAFQYQNLTVEWHIAMEHGQYYDNMIVYDGEENAASVYFRVCVNSSK